MRIESKKALKRIIEYEKNIYLPNSFRQKIIFIFTQNERWLFFKYLKYLRFQEYYLCRGKRGRVLFYHYSRKKNKLGNRINVKIMPLYVGKGVDIHHKGIIINGHIGENCIFHGNNCIGNNNTPDSRNELIPEIQNRVEFGYGSIVIGNVKIANDVKIGAGAVVVKDIDVCGATAVGVPARIVKK